MFQTIAVLDYGSQYTGLIVRRLRELRVHSRLYVGAVKAALLKEERNLAAIVLSGGGGGGDPEEEAPTCDPGIFNLGIPILGIGYGAQLMVKALGGEVVASDLRENRRAVARITAKAPLVEGLPEKFDILMNHGDRITGIPPGGIGFLAAADCQYAGFFLPDRRFYGLQFHPEVHHTPLGGEILENFLYKICDCKGDWLMADFAAAAIQEVKDKVGEAKAVMGISGGVDSTVAAVLLSEAIGDRLTCVFVDTGLLRKDEFERVVSRYGNRFSIIGVRAGERFLSALRGVTDPEEKRKTIGRVFIDVFQEEARKMPDVQFLGQGTLYPDVIESVGGYGGAETAVIKSHHNVGGLPEKMGLKLLEPLRELFKDEVRELGGNLGMPEDELRRHPFPGPGLAVRILGEVTAERVALLQEVDAIVLEEIHAAGWYRKLWQAFAVLLPLKTVGVKGDRRTYDNLAALRMVESADGMTADWAEVPHEFVRRISHRITSEVTGINRVVYDVTSKPPATIEWE
ncbi:MAG: glutamine-hydrolyzing GMP synthase [Planctomycetes bacterium]|nr:glutamine-hydrolyzing GMP synthase [Planctomycetota bacterium]